LPDKASSSIVWSRSSCTVRTPPSRRRSRSTRMTSCSSAWARMALRAAKK